MSNQNPKELFKKTISLVLGVLIISFALSFWVVAWTEPVQNPPEGNAPSPLNVGGAGQTKQGWLATLDSLWVGLPGSSLYPGVLQVLNGALINSNGAPNGLIVAQGKVGIGTLTPSADSRMEVNGDIKLTGNTPAFKITNVADPTDNSDVATKGYVLAQSGGSCTYGLRFAGYTGLFTGNLSGTKGANAKCAAIYPGSNYDKIHWCSVKELMELGKQYPYTYPVWARDAVKFVFCFDSSDLCWTILGGAGATSTYISYLEAEAVSDCVSWTSSNSNYGGGILTEAARGGRVEEAGALGCNAQYRLACCYFGI